MSSTSNTTFDIDRDQGAWAVRHAREVVTEAVEDGTKPSVPEDPDPVFGIESGAFVTLRKGGELCGCIGRPRPTQTLLEALRSAAFGAATDDPRFPPVKPRELPELTVEVSLLSPPEAIESVEPETVIVGRDGLIVERDRRSGLLLPQVPVDQGWTAKEFLAGTCRKAGLPEDCWKQSGTRVERFEAQVFEETEPAGPVQPVEDVSTGDRDE
ncbi:MAG: TIGR00296 family protein [Halodesulfurarchaeum sp.]